MNSVAQQIVKNLQRAKDASIAALEQYQEMLNKAPQESKFSEQSKMKPTEEQSIAENLRAALNAVRRASDNYQKVLLKSAKQPKFAVGKPIFYKERVVQVIDYDESGVPKYLIMPEGCNVGLWVYESALSPLPEMYVGRKWVLKQEFNDWNDLLVECVREDVTYSDYEQFIGRSNNRDRLSSCSNYPGKMADGDWDDDFKHFIIICIDPAFWTGEICGEKVRCYEYINSGIDGLVKIMYSSLQKHITLDATDLGEKLWLSAIKDANIPIMPHSQSQGNYLPPEEK